MCLQVEVTDAASSGLVVASSSSSVLVPEYSSSSKARSGRWAKLLNIAGRGLESIVEENDDEPAMQVSQRRRLLCRILHLKSR